MCMCPIWNNRAKGTDEILANTHKATPDKQSYLVTVCHFSNWIEVVKLEDTLSSTVIEKTKAHIARFGITAICHTDNGAQFISE